jgi:UDPglucose 6-dehydrogenase
MNVVIAGTGYVGLTTGVVLAYLGHTVTCLDVDEDKIEMLNQGKVPIYEPGLEELMASAQDRLRFVLGYADAGIAEADVIFIGVGTPSRLDGSPNLDYVRQAAESIGRHLGPGFTVVVNKSTVPIGSGNWVGALMTDAYFDRNGQRPNGCFAVASNPEFLREGSAIYDTLYPDRIVVGAEQSQAIDVLTNLYRPILNQDFPAPEFLPRPEGFSVVPLVTADLASAELIKYAANAFLSTKISYINEIGRLAEKVGADITQIARGIGLDTRIGPRFLQAGIGWGGSCFGKDTAALISTAEEYKLEMPIVSAARQVNFTQRDLVVEKLLQQLKILKGTTIALLGLAFKPNTDDLRDAPALDIARLLIERGAKVNVHDPVALHAAQQQYPDIGMIFCDQVDQAVEGADAIVLVTDWPQYRKLDWGAIRQRVKQAYVLDGRNFLPRETLETKGFLYQGIGL